jgi:predicted esterase
LFWIEEAFIMTLGNVKGLLLALLLVTIPTGSAQAKGSKIFDALDKISKSDKPLDQKKSLSKLGKPAKLLKSIRSGRHSTRPLSAGTHSEIVNDGFGRSTDLNIVIPSGKAPRKGFGVFILLHGLGGNGKQLIPQYQSFANQQKLIIIAPSAQKLPSGGSAGSNGKKLPGNEDTMGREMLQHWWLYRNNGFAMNGLKYIKSRAFVDTNRVYMSGYSMGGYGTWNIGLRFHDKFAALVPLAGALSRRERYGVVDDQTRPIINNGKRLPIYFVHGAKDTTVPPESDRRNAKQLKAMKAPYVYKEDPNAAHNLSGFLASNARELQGWIAKHRRNSSPKLVEHHSIGEYMGRCYWLEILKSSGKKCSIQAKVTSKSKIEVKTKNVESFRIYFDEKLVKVKKMITITCNGKRVYGAKPKASVEAIIHSWIGREDPNLCYSYELDIKVPTTGS